MLDGEAYLENSYLSRNGARAVSALGSSILFLRHCEVRGNGDGFPTIQLDPECEIKFSKCSGDAEAEKIFTQQKSKGPGKTG